MDYNRISKVQREIMGKFLKPLNRDVGDTCLLNILNAKLSQMVSFKHIKFKETEAQVPQIFNYYALNFISSGGGKDKSINDIDDYLFPKFKNYFNSKNQEYRLDQMNKLSQEAQGLYDSSKQRQSYIDNEKKKFRNLRFSLKDATSEGLTEDCKAVSSAGYGSIFIKLAELSLYLEHPSPPQQLFLDNLIGIYDGKSLPKSIKIEAEASESEGIPCCLLAYSDPSNLFNGKAKIYLDKMLETGLARRSFITYMPNCPLTIEEDYLKEKQIKNDAYEAAKFLSEDLFEKFNSLAYNSEFVLSEQAYDLYHKYINKNRKDYNLMLKTANGTALKEVRSRFWKTLKLSVLIACLEHPDDINIYPEDMEKAIYQAEMFAKDFEQFFNTKIEDNTEKLFKYLLSKQGTSVSKLDIRKQRFVNNNVFSKWFQEQLEYVREMAASNGLILQEKSFHNNTGKQYCLLENRLNQNLSPEVIPFSKLIGLEVKSNG